MLTILFPSWHVCFVMFYNAEEVHECCKCVIRYIFIWKAKQTKNKIVARYFSLYMHSTLYQIVLRGYLEHNIQPNATKKNVLHLQNFMCAFGCVVTVWPFVTIGFDLSTNALSTSFRCDVFDIVVKNKMHFSSLICCIEKCIRRFCLANV